MKKIVKPHKTRKPSASTDVPSFTRGKDQILKNLTRLQRRKKNELGEFDDGKDEYVPSDKVRKHIADWEASDFEKQNKQFGGDAISAKAKEFNDMLGNYAVAIEQDMADGLFSTFYNLSPTTFETRILPVVRSFVDYPSSETYNSLNSIITNRYNWAKDEHKNGIMRRAKADAEFFNPSQIQQRKDRITKGKLRMLHRDIDRNIQNYLTAPNDNTRVSRPILYRGGKDDHKYYDYIITQSMLGNSTAKRMTGEDDRYIPAFGQGDRSNLVIGSYGNYATPSVMNVGGELMYIPNPWAVFPDWMVQNQSFKFNNPNDAIDFAENYKYSSPAFSEFFGVNNSVNYNKGKDSGIHIKKANRGKFTAAAKRAGMGVQAYARKILNAPKGKYSSTLRKRANFAANAAKWHK